MGSSAGMPASRYCNLYNIFLPVKQSPGDGLSDDPAGGLLSAPNVYQDLPSLILVMALFSKPTAAMPRMASMPLPKVFYPPQHPHWIDHHPLINFLIPSGIPPRSICLAPAWQAVELAQ
ncbi:hypothetical protein DSO57_1010993 [Entomophthora muscae]|uniref:Uncharacterized protein n=1 Tax=Entomophthora muscae TaxID=34485 RepID=A0ACC2RL63_9FUNG|nr:hypothetical protein DSO57_1010993 [Entomophthora muscae]